MLIRDLSVHAIPWAYRVVPLMGHRPRYPVPGDGIGYARILWLCGRYAGPDLGLG